MPAKSRSQQRLFGMVHAYNKGEFHGSCSLRNRIAGIARRISDEDAQHFAKTPQKNLPETKTAQVLLRPDDVQALYGKIPEGVYADVIMPRSERRRSFLGQVLRGTAVGALAGGLGTGALGVFLANKAMQGHPFHNKSETNRRLMESGIRSGLWGAGNGAIAGALLGTGLGIWDKIRG